MACKSDGCKRSVILGISLYAARDGRKQEMHCLDTWKKRIPDTKLSAYKQLVDEDQIKILLVVYDRQTKVTTVEYDSIVPHEQILKELKRRSL
jgi:hypothetical protein